MNLFSGHLEMFYLLFDLTQLGTIKVKGKCFLRKLWYGNVLVNLATNPSTGEIFQLHISQKNDKLHVYNVSKI